MIIGDAHALISGQRIIFTAFAYVFQRIKFFRYVYQGLSGSQWAVGCALAVLVQPLDDEIRPQVPVSPSPVFASLESCSGDWC
ncbi:hypothetical protein HTZ85_23880 [Escherichia coli]|nr:hypothetical protein [Escherichia coli]